MITSESFFLPMSEHTYRLTAHGHNTIDSFRDEGIWEETKKKIAERGGSATFEMVIKIAKGLLKKKLSEHADIDL